MHFKLRLFVFTLATAYIVHSLKTSTYLRALDGVICEFFGNLKPDEYSKLCNYIDSYNNYTRQFVDRLAAKDPEFRKIAIVHCDWGKPKFPKYHDRIWYEVWMEWNDSQLYQLDVLVNTTSSLWREYKQYCKDGNYTRYLNRFDGYSNSSEITIN